MDRNNTRGQNKRGLRARNRPSNNRRPPSRRGSSSPLPPNNNDDDTPTPPQGSLPSSPPPPPPPSSQSSSSRTPGNSSRILRSSSNNSPDDNNDNSSPAASSPKRPTQSSSSSSRRSSGLKRPGGSTRAPRPAAGRSSSGSPLLDRGETRLRAVQRLRRLAWELEIEGILRAEGPLRNPASSPITQATIAPPPAAAGGQAPTGNDVIVLLDDDDADDSNNPATPASGMGTAPSGGALNTSCDGPYLGSSVTTTRTNRLLRFQQRSISVGQYPSPQAGIRFDLDGLRRALAGPRAPAVLPTEASVSDEFQRQAFRDEAPLCFDQAVTNNWLREAGKLYRGLPMVDRTVFFAANYAGLQSNCFFKAVAYQVYGSRTFDARVKAEYLQYFSDILKWPEHPRHDMYTRLNEWFYESHVSQSQGGRGGGGAGGGGRGTIGLAANFYQLLTIPNCYTPMDMFEVTADLYNLFIVTWTLDDNDVVTEMTTKGSYNARHIFMLSAGTTSDQWYQMITMRLKSSCPG